MLRSGVLDVRVDTAFPRGVGYTHRATGAVLYGQSDPVGTLLVDGAEHTPRVTSVPGEDRITYTLVLDGGAVIHAEIQVDGDRVHWRITKVADTAALRVGTLDFPGLAFLAVRSDQPGAVLLAARIDLDKAKSGDTLVQVTPDTAIEAATGCAYAVVAHDGLGGAVETNTGYDRPTSESGTTWENGRLWRSTGKAGRQVEARLALGRFTHRAATSPVDATEPLPYATVIVTGDRNGDGKVDWQDAAIAFRDVMVLPLGAAEQHLRVVPHIPFNFASQATNPFLLTLDHVKRISLATDGLRQYTLLKGYQSEGHDSAHPDYAGNHNKRAGGLDDLNTLVREGRKWGSDFGVHVNATESYPVANAFSETLVDKSDEQWDWLDQSYRIDARRDLVSGDIVKRFADLRAEADPALNTLYIDVFRESGWNSDRLQRALRDQGWHITTEWSHGLERSSLWSHWATETDYGPDTSRGINSRLIRFIRNDHKDVSPTSGPPFSASRAPATSRAGSARPTGACSTTRSGRTRCPPVPPGTPHQDLDRARDHPVRRHGDEGVRRERQAGHHHRRPDRVRRRPLPAALGAEEGPRPAEALPLRARCGRQHLAAAARLVGPAERRRVPAHRPGPCACR